MKSYLITFEHWSGMKMVYAAMAETPLDAQNAMLRCHGIKSKAIHTAEITERGVTIYVAPDIKEIKVL